MTAVGAQQPPPLAVASVCLKFSPKFAVLRFPHPSLSSSPFRSSPSYISASISISHSRAPLFSLPLSLSVRRRPPPRVLSVAEGEEQTAVAVEEEEKAEDDGAVADGAGMSEKFKVRVRPCELYICNLPRSCDISQLLDIFKPFGIVYSVEISRDAETGLSRGCGYVTMSSLQEARAAITALDKSDLGGREMRVRFSADMGSGRRNTEALNTAPKKDLVFESPHKVYVGNLAWSVTPETLREHFSQFGTVVSARLVFDRKSGRNRVYGFVSFSSHDELKASLEISGSVFHERILLVREVIDREEF